MVINEKICIANIFNPHPPQHLPNNSFNMFVVDFDTLKTIDFLNFIDKVFRQFFYTQAPVICRVDWMIHP